VRGHLDRIARDADPAGGVSSETGPQFSSDWRGRWSAAAARVSGPGFPRDEGLGDIVRRPGVEPCTLSLQRSRAVRINTGIPDRAAHASSTEMPSISAADIEHDRVVRLAVAEEMPFLAVEGAVDHITGVVSAVVS